MFKTYVSLSLEATVLKKRSDTLDTNQKKVSHKSTHKFIMKLLTRFFPKYRHSFLIFYFRE